MNVDDGAYRLACAVGEDGDMSVAMFCALFEEHAVVDYGGDEMAGTGEGSFDRQEEFVLQEVAYSGGEAAGNSTGGGGVVGGYQPGKVGNLHERFSRSRL